MGANFVVTEFLYGVAAGESTCDTLVALCAPPHGFNSDTACVCTGLIRVSDHKGGTCQPWLDDTWCSVTSASSCRSGEIFACGDAKDPSACQEGYVACSTPDLR